MDGEPQSWNCSTNETDMKREGGRVIKCIAPNCCIYECFDCRFCGTRRVFNVMASTRTLHEVIWACIQPRQSTYNECEQPIRSLKADHVSPKRCIISDEYHLRGQLSLRGGNSQRVSSVQVRLPIYLQSLNLGYQTPR